MDIHDFNEKCFNELNNMVKKDYLIKVEDTSEFDIVYPCGMDKDALYDFYKLNFIKDVNYLVQFNSLLNFHNILNKYCNYIKQSEGLDQEIISTFRTKYLKNKQDEKINSKYDHKKLKKYDHKKLKKYHLNNLKAMDELTYQHIACFSDSLILNDDFLESYRIKLMELVEKILDNINIHLLINV